MRKNDSMSHNFAVIASADKNVLNKLKAEQTGLQYT